MADLGEIESVVGHEQAFHRPCIVVQSFNSLQLALVIPITSSTKLTHYSIIKIAKGEGGLTTESYALCHQMRTISLQRITSTRGTLPDRTFNKIRGVLRDIMEL